MHRNNTSSGVSCNLIDFFDRADIDLVVHVETSDVNSVSLNGINELINAVIVSKGDLTVVHLVLRTDVSNDLIINLSELLDCGIMDTATFSLSNSDSGRFFVKSDTNRFKLMSELSLLISSLLNVEDHKDKICRFTTSDNLSSSSLTFGGTLNDTGKIEKLDSRIIVLNESGDTGQGSELVRCSF